MSQIVRLLEMCDRGRTVCSRNHPHRLHTESPVYAIPMRVTLDIPDTLAAQLIAAGLDPARAALESLAGCRVPRS